MDTKLIEPVRITFDGGEADYHRMDALQLGQSLMGAARIYNSVGTLFFDGKLQNSAHSKIRTQVGPPQQGSIFYLLYLLMVHGEMAVYPQLLFSLAETAVPEFVRAMIAKRTGQDRQLEKALDMLERTNERYHEVVRVGQDNDMRSRSELINVIDKLASKNGNSMSQMAAPVGKSVKELRHEPAGAESITIDAATADSLRSDKTVTVGDPVKFIGTITALDLTNGNFKLVVADSEELLKGIVTDPALKTASNIYSHSLDAVQVVEVLAKPTLNEDGSINKLYVSHAVPVDS